MDRKTLRVRLVHSFKGAKRVHYITHARLRLLFWISSAVFSWAIDNCFEMFFGEGWNSMSSLPPFQTLRMTRGYFNNQSANKTEKKAEDLKFEIWFSDNRDAHMRLQIFKVSLEMLICLTSMNHEVVCGDDREIFVTIIEGSSEFDLILLQLWNKIV